MKGLLCFAYGLACYAVFGVAFVYAILFLANIVLPVTIDFGPARDPLTSALIDLALLAVFAIQHSVMARRAICTDILHFPARVLAVYGHGYSSATLTDPGHGFGRVLERPHGPILLAGTSPTHGSAEPMVAWAVNSVGGHAAVSNNGHVGAGR